MIVLSGLATLFRLCQLNCEDMSIVYVPKVCTSTKVFKSGFVKFCSNKKDLNLLRNLYAYVHACNGTKLSKSGFVKFCSDKKPPYFENLHKWYQTVYVRSCQILIK